MTRVRASDPEPTPEQPAAGVRRAIALRRARAAALRRRRPVLTVLVPILVCALALVLADAVALSARLERLDLALPAPAPGPQTPGAGAAPAETWLIIGTDSRADAPAGPDRYGAATEAGDGGRADVIALLQPRPDGLTVLVIPRDLTIGPSFSEERRLAVSYLSGPQSTVDLLCSELGVTTTHLITVDMAQFARIVDAAGGVDVEVDEPVRDESSGLDLPQAGAQHLSGIDALALVRSRHPRVRRDGDWVALSEEEGAARRSRYTGVVMRAVMAGLRERSRNPLAAHSLAWTLTGNLGVDSSTGLTGLIGLARTALGAGADSVEVVDVPAPVVNNTFVAYPTPQTYAVLARYGYVPGRCRPAG